MDRVDPLGQHEIFLWQWVVEVLISQTYLKGLYMYYKNTHIMRMLFNCVNKYMTVIYMYRWMQRGIF